MQSLITSPTPYYPAMPYSANMQLLSAFFIIFTAISGVLCGDPDPLQDLCVADYSSRINVNGYGCKDAADVTADNFYYDMNPGGVPNDTFRVIPKLANVQGLPGLNTLGISMSRLDFAPGGEVPRHTHPRATKAVVVLEGAVDISFITSSNVVMTKTVNKGGIFVAPRGLIHYLKNNTNKTAVAVAAFNSQLPGMHTIPHWMLKG